MHASWDCKDSKYCYQPTGHIVIGDLKIITDSRIRSTICKGPKYRFPLPIDFKSCREEIAGALQEFCNRWCRREHVESNALNSWKLNIFKIFDGRNSFYCSNLQLLPPKPKFTVDIWRKGSRSSIGGLFWPPQIRLLTMLWSFEKGIILTP